MSEVEKYGAGNDDIRTGNIEGVGIAIGRGASVKIYGDVHYYPVKLRAPLRRQFDGLLGIYTQLFGGRDAILTRFGEVIQDPAGGYLVITAPPGFGKTALMANLVSGTPEAFAYHFFSPLYGERSLREDTFLRNVVQQMAQWHGHEEAIPSELDELAALYHRFVAEKLEKTQVLVLDGLDEVTDWALAPYLDRTLPENLNIVVTIRDMGQDWRTYYRFPADQVTHLPLGGLNEGEIVDVLRSAGGGAETLAEMLIENETAMQQLVTVAAYEEDERLGADPFYVRLLAEDALTGDLTVDNISEQPQGLDGYLKRWWRQASKLAGDRPTRDLLGTLTVALGAIGRDELEAINPSLVDDWAADFFDDVVGSVRRFVIGNHARGYNLAHPRLRRYIRDSKRIKSISDYRQKVIDYCSRWPEHGSTYALRFYARHLEEANDKSSLYELAQDEEFALAQRRSLSSDLNLQLEPVQAALRLASKDDEPEEMARFVLLHAARVQQIMTGESPLDAAAAGEVGRAWNLADLQEPEEMPLWYLLLAWALHDQRDDEKAAETLARMSKFDLPLLEFWRGEAAAHLLLYALEVSQQAFVELQGRLLVDQQRYELCQTLINRGHVQVARQIVDSFERPDLTQAWMAAVYAQAQAEKAETEAALETVKEIDALLDDLFAADSGSRGAGDQETYRVVEWRSMALTAIAIAQARNGQLTKAQETVLEMSWGGRRSSWLTYDWSVKAYGGFLNTIQEPDEIEKVRAMIDTHLTRLLASPEGSGRDKALASMAEALYRAGDEPAAREAAAGLGDVYGYKDDLSEAIVKILAESGEFDQAVEEAQQIGNDNKRSSALKEVLKAQIEAGEPEAALELGHRLGVQDVDLQVTKTAAFNQAVAGDLMGALETVEEMKNALGYDWQRTVNQIALALVDAGDEAAARKAFAVPLAAKQKPEAGSMGDVLEPMALALIDSKDWEAAVEIADVLGSEPRQVEVKVQVAAAQAREGLQDMAGDSFTVAMKAAESVPAGPKRANAFIEVARSAREVGLEETAGRALEEAISAANDTSGDNGKAYAPVSLARLQIDMGDLEGAHATLQRSAESARQEDRGWHRSYELAGLAALEAEAGNTDAARKLFDEGLEAAAEVDADADLSHMRAAAMNRIVEKQAQSGLWEEARQTATMIADVELENWGKAQAAIVMALHNNGQEEAARQTFANALVQLEQHEETLRAAVAAYKESSQDRSPAGLERFKEAMDTRSKYGFGRTLEGARLALAEAQAHMAPFWDAMGLADAIKEPEIKARAFRKVASIGVAAGLPQDARTVLGLAVSQASKIQGPRERAKSLGAIAVSQAKAGDITAALVTCGRIEEAERRAQTLVEIGTLQSAEDPEGARNTLADAVVWAERTDERRQDELLVAVGVAQARGGFGGDAIATAERILTYRSYRLLNIAAGLVESGHREELKRLLIPCAYFPTAALGICPLLARAYPEKAVSVAGVLAASLSDTDAGWGETDPDQLMLL